MAYNIMSNECKTCGSGPIPENRTFCPKHERENLDEDQDFDVLESEDAAGFYNDGQLV